MSSTARIESSKIETLSGAPGKSVTAEATGRGGRTMSLEVYQAPGCYGVPVKGDNVIYEGFGEQRIVTGVQDYKFSLTVKPGEYVAYSRDASGVIKGYTHYKDDGSVLTKNDNGSQELKANGDHVFNDGSTSAVKFDELKTALDSEFAAIDAAISGLGGSYTPSPASIDSSEVPEVKF